MIHNSDNKQGITSQLAAARIGSKYDLILVGARRARELNRGWKPMVDPRNNGHVVTAIREIEEGKIGRDYLLKPQNIDRREKPPHEKEPE